MSLSRDNGDFLLKSTKESEIMTFLGYCIDRHQHFIVLLFNRNIVWNNRIIVSLQCFFFLAICWCCTTSRERIVLLSPNCGRRTEATPFLRLSGRSGECHFDQHRWQDGRSYRMDDHRWGLLLLLLVLPIFWKLLPNDLTDWIICTTTEETNS